MALHAAKMPPEVVKLASVTIFSHLLQILLSVVQHLI
jgi:hypothetical protein